MSDRKFWVEEVDAAGVHRLAEKEFIIDGSFLMPGTWNEDELIDALTEIAVDAGGYFGGIVREVRDGQD